MLESNVAGANPSHSENRTKLDDCEQIAVPEGLRKYKVIWDEPPINQSELRTSFPKKLHQLPVKRVVEIISGHHLGKNGVVAVYSDKYYYEEIIVIVIKDEEAKDFGNGITHIDGYRIVIKKESVYLKEISLDNIFGIV